MAVNYGDRMRNIIKVITLSILVAFFAITPTFLWERGFSLSPTKLLKEDDISMQKPYKCTNDQYHNTWLVSYAEGEIYIANENYLVSSSINKCIDFYLPYKLKDIDSNFLEKNKKIMDQKRGAGYWLWKPYLILKTLKQIPEGDFIIYIDSGVSLIKPIDDLINMLKDDKEIIFFSNYHDNTQYMKRDLLRLFNMDNEKYRKTIGIGATFMVIKNTEFTRKFMEQWLHWCANEIALTDTPSDNEYKEFIDHRHDQSILTLMWIQNQESSEKNKIVTLPNDEIYEYFFLHRRRKFNVSIPNKEILFLLKKEFRSMFHMKK